MMLFRLIFVSSFLLTITACESSQSFTPAKQERLDCQNGSFMKTKISSAAFLDVTTKASIGICERTDGSLDLLIVDESSWDAIERIPVGYQSPFPKLEIRSKSSVPVRNTKVIKNLSPELVALGVKSSKVAYLSADNMMYREFFISNGEWRSILVH